MYKKAAVVLMMVQMIVICAGLNVKGIFINRCASMNISQIQLNGEEKEYERSMFGGNIKGVISSQRVMTVNLMERKSIISYNEEDYNNLLKIVEAEAGCEDRTGKLLVANVVINRVKNKNFPDTVTAVIFQKENGVTQFSPVSDGRLNKVVISEETIEAVESAIYGEDVSTGALYFAARKSADAKRMAWFDRSLKKLFTYGGHEFFL